MSVLMKWYDEGYLCYCSTADELSSGTKSGYGESANLLQRLFQKFCKSRKSQTKGFRGLSVSLPEHRHSKSVAVNAVI